MPEIHTETAQRLKSNLGLQLENALLLWLLFPLTLISRYLGSNCMADFLLS